MLFAKSSYDGQGDLYTLIHLVGKRLLFDMDLVNAVVRTLTSKIYTYMQ